MRTALLAHKLSEHRSEKLSKLINTMFEQDILYSSDSECEYEVELRIKRIPKQTNYEELQTDDNYIETLEENLEDIEYAEAETCENLVVEDNPKVNEKRFQCDICQKYFVSSSSIAAHLKKIHKFENLKSLEIVKSDVMYECFMCRKHFFQFQDLQIHLSIAHQPTNISASSVENEPRKRKIKKRNFCLHCNTLFSQRQEYEEHLNALKMGKPFFCKTCFTPFDNRTDILQHKRENKTCKPVANPKTRLCDYCGKYFERKHTLEIHMRSHNTTKPFECTSCSKTFITLGALQQHMNSHTGERPYVCSEPDCGKSFSYVSALRQHRTNVHEPRKLKCLHCDRMFSKREHME